VVAAALVWLLGLGIWRRQQGLVAVLGVGLVLAAGWQYALASHPSPSALAPFVGSGPVRLRGVVEAEPEALGRAVRYRVAVRHVQVEAGWQGVRGRVLAILPASLAFRYGDLLELEGELEPVTADYLARQGIEGLMSYPRARWLAGGLGDPFMARIIDLRQRLAGALVRALPEPEASLAQGVLLGRRAALPQEALRAMDAAGLSHLLAASGQNVALIAGMTVAALGWLVGRRQAAALGLALTGGYAFLVGGSPPIVRAAIMGGLYGLALMMGRPGGGLQPLLLAGAAMTAWDPSLVDDVSFQLSFASTLGLVLMAGPLQALAWRWLEGRAPVALLGLLRPVVGVTAMTVAAVAFTLPVSALTFREASAVAVAANVLAVPAFAPLLATAALVSVLGVVWGGLAPWLGWLAWPWAAYTLAVAQAMASVPGAVVSLREVGLGHALAYVLALGLAVWAVRRGGRVAMRPPPPSWTPVAALALVALAGGMAWLWASLPSGDALRVAFLDVGDGAAALVTTPAGHRLLIDGGPSGEALMAALGRQLPFWERRLDMVVLTAPKAGRLGGLPEAMERYRVGQVLAAPMSAPTGLFRAFQEAVSRHDVSQRWGREGVRVPLGRGALLEVLYPPEEGPLALRLSYGDVSFLFLSDLGPEEQERLATEHDLRADVLLLPRAGARDSLSPMALDEMAPKVAVLSVARGDRFGRPSPQTLRLLEGVLVLRTDHDGDVVVETDGHRLWVRRGR